MRVLSLLAAAFVIAASAFWATMLIRPPTSQAQVQVPTTIQWPTFKERADSGRRFADDEVNVSGL